MAMIRVMFLSVIVMATVKAEGGVTFALSTQGDEVR